MTLTRLKTAVTFLTLPELCEMLDRMKEMCKYVSSGNKEHYRKDIVERELIRRGMGVLIN